MWLLLRSGLHSGNSIDNSRDFVPDLDKAISPVCGNINISIRHGAFMKELKIHLGILREEILAGIGQADLLYRLWSWSRQL